MVTMLANWHRKYGQVFKDNLLLSWKAVAITLLIEDDYTRKLEEVKKTIDINIDKLSNSELFNANTKLYDAYGYSPDRYEVYYYGDVERFTGFEL